MKFTSEDLLKAMGLKETDFIHYGESDYKIVLSDWSKKYYLQDNRGVDRYILSDLVNEDYTIIQPTPTLTEDEKVILRNSPCTEISREMNDDGFGGVRENLWLIKGEIKYDFNLFRHLFKSIPIGQRYETKVLLKE